MGERFLMCQFSGKTATLGTVPDVILYYNITLLTLTGGEQEIPVSVKHYTAPS